MPSTGLIMLGIVLVIAMIMLSQSVIVVQQTEAFIIERLGVYNRTLHAGIHYIVPGVDRIVKKVSLTEKTHVTMKTPFKTLDDEVLELQVSLYYLIRDPKLFNYALNSEQSLSPLILDKTKYHILKSNKQDVKLDLKEIELSLLEELNSTLGVYGIAGIRLSIEI